MPKVGNSDAVRFPYYEVIEAILSGDKLNMVEWMATRMMECRLGQERCLGLLVVHHGIGQSQDGCLGC